MKKIYAPTNQTNYQNGTLWSHRVRFVRFWSVLGECEFSISFDWQKVGLPNQTDQKTGSAETTRS